MNIFYISINSDEMHVNNEFIKLNNDFIEMEENALNDIKYNDQLREFIDNANLSSLLQPENTNTKNKSTYEEFNFCKFITLCKELLNQENYQNKAEINNKIDQFIDTVKSIEMNVLLYNLQEKGSKILDKLKHSRDLCDEILTSNKLYKDNKDLEHLSDAVNKIINLKNEIINHKDIETLIQSYSLIIKNFKNLDVNVIKKLNDNLGILNNMNKFSQKIINDLEDLIPKDDLLYIAHLRQGYENIKKSTSKEVYIQSLFLDLMNIKNSINQISISNDESDKEKRKMINIINQIILNYTILSSFQCKLSIISLGNEDIEKLNEFYISCDNFIKNSSNTKSIKISSNYTSNISKKIENIISLFNKNNQSLLVLTEKMDNNALSKLHNNMI